RKLYKGGFFIQETITKKDLVRRGYPEYTAVKIIRQAKQIMVQQGYPFYNNKRLGRVPKKTVESILGCELGLEENT
uniref:DUF3173 domain-containing protein n=1 Tax=Listeria seeligeri TaxID=1640 RepID=UPI0035D89A66